MKLLFKGEILIRDFKKLSKDNKYVITSHNEIKFYYNCFLNNHVIFYRYGPLSLNDIIHNIKMDYRKIYREEMGTATVPIKGKKRNPTNGKYEIFGPYYDEIYLKKIWYNSKNHTITVLLE